MHFLRNHLFHFTRGIVWKIYNNLILHFSAWANYIFVAPNLEKKTPEKYISCSFFPTFIRNLLYLSEKCRKTIYIEREYKIKTLAENPWNVIDQSGTFRVSWRHADFFCLRLAHLASFPKHQFSFISPDTSLVAVQVIVRIVCYFLFRY